MSDGVLTTNDMGPKKRKKMLGLVRSWVKQKQPAGDGGCWALPLKALNEAGAQMPCRTTTCGAGQGLYVWGRRIDQKSLARGDIIQIKGVITFTNRADTTDWELGSVDDPHHSMIVMRVGTPGKDGPVVKVAHQWKGKSVFYSWLRLGSNRGNGTVYYYRPQSTKK